MAMPLGAELAPRLLFRPGDVAGAPASVIPAWAADLRLDELAHGLGPGGDGVERLAVLLDPLGSVDAVRFRQEVFRDLEDPGLGDALRALAEALAAVRATLDRAARMRHAAERDRWILDAIERHDAAVLNLAAALGRGRVASRGLTAVRDHLAATVAEPGFLRRRAEAAAALEALDGVAFRLRIGRQRVVVGEVRDEPDLASEIRATFERFREAEPAPSRVDVFDTLDMNPLEAQVLARVARLAPEPFARLAATAAAHRRVIDPWIATVADDAAWYLAVLDLLAPLRAAGLPCGYPIVVEDGRLVADGLFDLVLARRLVAGGSEVARSGVELEPGERLVVVTGPSRGGRTSFARAVGQLHVLAAAGCPVPAASATVPLVDAVRTVFDRPERLDDPGGRLRVELRRIRAMLDATTPRTLVVANEPFASTTAEDALDLARRLATAAQARGARVVAVTFLEELAADPAAVSIAAVVDPSDPTARTYRFERRPADGLAHAQALAARHGLGAAAIQARMRR
jgi:DNA mismatch repair protein MutS